MVGALPAVLTIGYVPANPRSTTSGLSGVLFVCVLMCSSHQPFLS